MRQARMGARTRWAALVAAGLIWCGAGPARAADLAARGREIVRRWEQAVITVSLTVKVSMSAEGRQLQEEENTQELRATVIDPSGLAVCSLAEADPSQMFSAWGAEEQGYRWEVNITGVKMRLADGRELPAKVVLRDKDLDLAFVRPTEPQAQPLVAVDLADGGAVDVLDEVLVVGRLGEVGNRAPTAVIDQIAAILSKPRKLYVPGPNGMSSDAGCPVFTLEGKVVGILLNRILPSAGGSREEPGWMSVILPAQEILAVARQAPAG